MMRKEKLDGFGFASLTGVAVLFVGAWLTARGRPPRLRTQDIVPGVLAGAIFSVEFLSLFMALDLTTLGRTGVIFYSMPLWLALMCHFGLPNERITRQKALGLVLAFAGTAIAILSRGDQTGGSLAGDLLALCAALGWAGTAFLTRRTTLKEIGAEMQLFWMILVSGPILLLCAPLFGPLVRAFTEWHLVGLIFQSSVVVAGGFIFWLWLLAAYPAATVASFSFLTPLFGLGLGILLYGEEVTLRFGISCVLIGLGIVLINGKPWLAAKRKADTTS